MTTPQASARDLGREQQPDAPRELRRSHDDRIFGGVCAGLAHYLGIDPIVVRIGFAALTLAGGAGVLVYVIAWIVMPEDANEDSVAERRGAFRAPQAVVGVALVFIGALLLVNQLLPSLDEYLWPLLLVALGVTILIRGEQR